MNVPLFANKYEELTCVNHPLSVIFSNDRDIIEMSKVIEFTSTVMKYAPNKLTKAKYEDQIIERFLNRKYNIELYLQVKKKYTHIICTKYFFTIV